MDPKGIPEPTGGTKQSLPSGENRRADACRLSLPNLDDPTVSIVICNFNHGRFVRRAVESALEQDARCEVIVVDDGSTDASLRHLRPLSNRIRLIQIPHQGQRVAYGAGFKECRGGVVVFLDADDFLFPFAVTEILKKMRRRVARVHFRLSLVNEASQQLGVIIPHEQAAGWLAPHLLSGILPPSAPGSGNAYRREVLERLLPLPTDPDDRHGADFFLVYGSMLLGDVEAIEQPLGAYRVRTDQPNHASEHFFFGNAAKRKDRERIIDRRIDQWAPWLNERLKTELKFPKKMVDFSTMKSVFASRVLQHGYVEGGVKGLRYSPLLLRSIWLHPQYTPWRKVGLTAWASLLLLLPRPMGYPIARYVIDPASRSSLRRIRKS